MNDPDRYDDSAEARQYAGHLTLEGMDGIDLGAVDRLEAVGAATAAAMAYLVEERNMRPLIAGQMVLGACSGVLFQGLGKEQG